MKTILYSLLLTLLAGSSAVANVTLIAEDVEHFTVLSDTEILVANSEGEILLMNLNSPMEGTPWVSDWDPVAEGWQESTRLWRLTASPDGSLVCHAAFARVSADLLAPDEFYAGPLVVVVCRRDGSEARAVAISQEVGGGPNFDFTMDSRYLYGQPFFRCEPTAEGYLEFMRSIREENWEEGWEIEPFASIDLISGDRLGNRGPLSDGYETNPFSDLVAGGCFPPNAIIRMPGTEILVDFGIPSGTELGSWVLPDACLAWRGGRQGLLYSDGSFVPSPAAAEIDVYCCLPTGNYIFSVDEGDSILYGAIDWDTFTGNDYVHVPDLEDLISRWTMATATPDGKGILFRRYEDRGLYYFPVPE